MPNNKNAIQGNTEAGNDIETKSNVETAIVEHVKQEKMTGRGGKHNFPNAQNTESPDEARQILAEVMRWRKMPRIPSAEQYDDECAKRLDFFFDACMETGERPTVEKMCLALGVYRDTLWEWERGVGCSAYRTDIIKQAKMTLSSYDAGLAITGKMNPVPYIFRAKNYYGMKDEQEVVLTPNNPLGNVDNPNDIAQKYEQLPEE